jgi:pimeloyl-ACP methyl ester carboxylesterase
MAEARQQFIDAQRRILQRYGVEAKSRFIKIPSINGQAHVLTCGEGPPVLMINGIGTPGAMWAPLMAELKDFSLYVVDLPGYGLTDAPDNFAVDLKRNALRFLNEVIIQLDFHSPFFIVNSLASLFSSWLALEYPKKIRAFVHLGCPALVLGTSAPLPMRLLSVNHLGQLISRLQPPSEKQVKQLSKMVKQHPLRPELVDLLVATEQLPNYRHTFLSSLNKLLRLRGSRPEMRLTARELSEITQPTLVFWGENDPFGSVEVGKKMVDSMPSAKLQIVKGGHAPWLNETQKIASQTTAFFERIDRES